MKSRQMHLNIFSTFGGYHQCGWRISDADPERFFDLSYYVDMAETCEGAKLDSLFVADISSAGAHLRVSPHEALTLASVLVTATERLGLIATVSTTLNEPYGLARRFSSLDKLSGGRVAWNIVTSYSQPEMENYGIEGLPSHADRYRRGEEFVTVVKQLWDSWDEDALVFDRGTGILFDSDRVHPINHSGEHFRVRGPLTQPRSPQGWPVLVQAGSSKDGIEFAARHAEVVFTVQPTLEAAQDFRTKLRALAAKGGRNPETVKVLPGLFPIMGETTEEAKQRMDELASMLDPKQMIQDMMSAVGPEIDLTDYPLDEPLPVNILDRTEAHQARTKIFSEMISGGDVTFREVLTRVSMGNGHHVVVGSYEEVADDMQLWFEAGACDGFNVEPPSMPRDLRVFVEKVVPILQARGIFRTEYEETTLRDRFGLPRPVMADRRQPV